MAAHDPIAYVYDADYHCPECAEARFGRCACGFIACPGGGTRCSDPPLDCRDAEGNEAGVIAPWDEWHDPGEPVPHVLACGDCHREIERIEEGE